MKNHRLWIRVYIENYNSLYAILAVKFRDKKFLKVVLEKFPKIEFEKYEMTKRKLVTNYFLLTIGVFPIGLLVLLRSYLKLLTLKQKIDLVADKLKTIEDMVKVQLQEKTSES